MDTVEEIIRSLNLEPHPEGGYFRETYRSTGEISPNGLGQNYAGKRNYSTCIYFLLTSSTFSAFHKITQDEIWHFYMGSPVRIHMISDSGVYSDVIVGNDLEKKQLPQFVVPGGYWFAGEVINDNDYSLVGCTVSPGFDFKDFVLPKRKELMAKFPQHQRIVSKFTYK
ncbi:MAG: cupin domain-containing protein [Saonia sp.]